MRCSRGGGPGFIRSEPVKADNPPIKTDKQTKDTRTMATLFLAFLVTMLGFASGSMTVFD